MTTELTLTNDKIGLIKQTIMPADSTNAELELFIHFAKRTGLDPLARQIYAMKNKGKFSVITSIDGFRLIAERSGSYAGQTIPMYYDQDSESWLDVWVKKTFPAACKVGIHRKDFIEPMYAVAHWEAYAQKKADGSYSFAWRTMPTIMLAKCAEALALRKAFPQELSGLYTADELDTDKIHEPIEVKPIPVIDSTKQTKPKSAKRLYTDKLEAAKNLIELQSLISEVKPEWNTDEFKIFVKSLENKLKASIVSEVKELFNAEQVNTGSWIQKKGGLG